MPIELDPINPILWYAIASLFETRVHLSAAAAPWFCCPESASRCGSKSFHHLNTVRNHGSQPDGSTLES